MNKLIEEKLFKNEFGDYKWRYSDGTICTVDSEIGDAITGLLEASQQEALDGWVSVEDRLPKHDQCIDVYAIINSGEHCGDADRITDVFYDEQKEYFWKWDNKIINKLPLCFFDVTHWREILPPKQLKENEA